MLMFFLGCVGTPGFDKGIRGDKIRILGLARIWGFKGSSFRRLRWRFRGLPRVRPMEQKLTSKWLLVAMPRLGHLYDDHDSR